MQMAHFLVIIETNEKINNLTMLIIIRMKRIQEKNLKAHHKAIIIIFIKLIISVILKGYKQKRNKLEGKLNESSREKELSIPHR